MKQASLDKDCLPEPPTPTSKACEQGFEIILEIRQISQIASSNNTNGKSPFSSLYLCKYSAISAFKASYVLGCINTFGLSSEISVPNGTKMKGSANSSAKFGESYLKLALN